VILVLATENRDKGAEIGSIVRDQLDVDIRLLSDYLALTLPPETGTTYRENAIVKAVFAAKKTGEWAMGDDSGLAIDALNGAPGLYSARFAGESVSYADNRKKVLALLGDLPNEKRKARFVCTIAIANPEGEVGIVEGVCDGWIANHDTGQGGFGYDSIFCIPPDGKSFASLSPEEKNQISHRGKAVRAAAEFLKIKMRSCGA
jgi:XTP/dITP diphosphohydrolase